MSALAKTEIESLIADRVGRVFDWRERRPPELLPTGIAEIDTALGGLPRGAITELQGTPSCGRTSVLLSTLVAATSNEEICALIDGSDSFDLLSAQNAGVSFDRLLWVRCNHNLERAFKAVDLLLHGGGFGFIALNLADMPAKTLRRIISTWWFRFRRAIEDTPTVLVVATPVACVRSCAAMALELKRERTVWPGADSFVKGDWMTVPKRECGWPHLRLVITNNRSESRSPAINHSHLLQTLDVRVKRERPLSVSDHDILFTSHALTVFANIR